MWMPLTYVGIFYFLFSSCHLIGYGSCMYVEAKDSLLLRVPPLCTLHGLLSSHNLHSCGMNKSIAKKWQFQWITRWHFIFTIPPLQWCMLETLPPSIDYSIEVIPYLFHSTLSSTTVNALNMSLIVLFVSRNPLLAWILLVWCVLFWFPIDSRIFYPFWHGISLASSHAMAAPSPLLHSPWRVILMDPSLRYPHLVPSSKIWS